MCRVASITAAAQQLSCVQARGLQARGPAQPAARGAKNAHHQAARPGDDGHNDGQDKANGGPHNLHGSKQLLVS
jgi:hypothetical protein